MEFSNELQCPICFEIFKDPRSLNNCLHTFCENCLLQTFVSYVKRNHSFSEFPCPVCRVPVEGPSHGRVDIGWIRTFPVNHVVNSLLHCVQQEENVEPSCEPCSNTNKIVAAANFCIQCQEFMCLPCKQVHEKFKATKSHSVISVTELKTDKRRAIDFSKCLQCKYHKDKEVELFCVDDKQPVCVLCVSTTHRDCRNIVELKIEAESPDRVKQTKKKQEQLKELQQGLKSLILMMEQNVVDLEGQESEIQTLLKTKIEEVVSILNRYKSDIIDKFKYLKENKVKSMNEELEKCKRLYSAIKSSSSSFDTVMKYGSRIQAFATMLRMKAQLNEYESFMDKARKEIQSEKVVVIDKPPLWHFLNAYCIGYAKMQTYDPKIMPATIKKFEAGATGGNVSNEAENAENNNPGPRKVLKVKKVKKADGDESVSTEQLLSRVKNMMENHIEQPDRQGPLNSRSSLAATSTSGSTFSTALASGSTLSTVLASGSTLGTVTASGITLPTASASGSRLSTASVSRSTLDTLSASGITLSTASASGITLSTTSASRSTLDTLSASGITLSTASASRSTFRTSLATISTSGSNFSTASSSKTASAAASASGPILSTISASGPTLSTQTSNVSTDNDNYGGGKKVKVNTYKTAQAPRAISFSLNPSFNFGETTHLQQPNVSQTTFVSTSDSQAQASGTSLFQSITPKQQTTSDTTATKSSESTATNLGNIFSAVPVKSKKIDHKSKNRQQGGSRQYSFTSLSNSLAGLFFVPPKSSVAVHTAHGTVPQRSGSFSFLSDGRTSEQSSLSNGAAQNVLNSFPIQSPAVPSFVFKSSTVAVPDTRNAPDAFPFPTNLHPFGVSTTEPIPTFKFGPQSVSKPFSPNTQSPSRLDINDLDQTSKTAVISTHTLDSNMQLYQSPLQSSSQKQIRGTPSLFGQPSAEATPFSPTASGQALFANYFSMSTASGQGPIPCFASLAAQQSPGFHFSGMQICQQNNVLSNQSGLELNSNPPLLSSTFISASNIQQPNQNIHQSLYTNTAVSNSLHSPATLSSDAQFSLSTSSSGSKSVFNSVPAVPIYSSESKLTTTSSVGQSLSSVSQSNHSYIVRTPSDRVTTISDLSLTPKQPSGIAITKSANAYTTNQEKNKETITKEMNENTMMQNDYRVHIDKREENLTNTVRQLKIAGPGYGVNNDDGKAIKQQEFRGSSGLSSLSPIGAPRMSRKTSKSQRDKHNKSDLKSSPLEISLPQNWENSCKSVFKDVFDKKESLSVDEKIAADGSNTQITDDTGSTLTQSQLTLGHCQTNVKQSQGEEQSTGLSAQSAENALKENEPNYAEDVINPEKGRDSTETEVSTEVSGSHIDDHVKTTPG